MRTFITAITLLFSVQCVACQLHGLNFGIFGQQSGNNQFSRAIRPPQLEFTHPSSITVKTSEQNSIRVRYYQPSAYENIEVSIVPGTDIQLISAENVSLNKLFGAFELSFESMSSGEHQIELAIKGLMNGRPYFQVHKMTVLAE